jgi:hypothetical protein
VRTVNVSAGDWIVRMDQPYTALIRTVLALQRFRPDDPSPYDDTGWSLDELRHVTVRTIADSSVLTKPMQLLKEDARAPGLVAGNGGTLIVTHSGDWRSAVLPWRAAAQSRHMRSARSPRACLSLTWFMSGPGDKPPNGAAWQSGLDLAASRSGHDAGVGTR